MADRQLRKMSRKELLEMLVDREKTIMALEEEIEGLKSRLDDRTLRVEKAGTLAEAALELNRIFEDADAAARQYVENARRLTGDGGAKPRPAEAPKKKAALPETPEAKEDAADEKVTPPAAEEASPATRSDADDAEARLESLREAMRQFSETLGKMSDADTGSGGEE